MWTAISTFLEPYQHAQARMFREKVKLKEIPELQRFKKMFTYKRQRSSSLRWAPCDWDQATSMASSWMEEILPTRVGFCSNTKWTHPFRCENTIVSFMHVQPHYHYVRQVEPCHWLGCRSHTLFLSNWALGVMPIQHQHSFSWSGKCLMKKIGVLQVFSQS